MSASCLEIPQLVAGLNGLLRAIVGGSLQRTNVLPAHYLPLSVIFEYVAFLCVRRVQSNHFLLQAFTTIF